MRMAQAKVSQDTREASALPLATRAGSQRRTEEKIANSANSAKDAKKILI
jgi:hypothetical protein